MNDDYYKALGRLVVNFSSLDFYLSLVIWNLATPDLKKGKAITSELSFKAKISLFASLYRLANGNFLKNSTIYKLIQKLTEAENKRNMVIHSVWLIDGESNKVTRYKITSKLKNGLKDNFQEFTSDDLNKISILIGKAAKEVEDLAVRLTKKEKIIVDS